MALYNIELKLGYGGQLCRSAGSFAKILSKYPDTNSRLLIQLKSGEQYLISKNNYVTLGVNSNTAYRFKNWKKASMSRKLGFRPCVRGIAMNPIDHPHGGRTNGGCHFVSYSGILSKGRKTRKRPISSKLIFKRSKLDSLTKFL